MKKTILPLLIISIAFFSSAQNADIKKDEDAIKKVIQLAYVDGLQNQGDLEKIDAGIHPEFVLIGIEGGNDIWKLPIEEWKSRVVEKKDQGKYPRKGQEQVNIKFLNIDITGTAAVAKIEFYVGDEKRYVDYIALYKFEEGWKMVHKIFYKFDVEE